MAVKQRQQPPANSSKYVNFDEFIDYQLKKTRASIHQTELAAATLILVTGIAGYLLLFTLFDQWVFAHGFSDGARMGLLVVVLGGSVGWFVWRIARPWIRRVNALYAAREIERAHPEFKSSLMSWVDFRQRGREIPSGILRALEKRTAQQIERADVEQAVDRRLLARAAYALLAVVVLMALYSLISPKRMSTSIWRALLPTTSISAATRTTILKLTPGDVEVLARDQIDVEVELGGQIPSEATLIFSTADRRFTAEPVLMRRHAEDLPRFRGRLTGEGGRGLLSDVSYYVVAGDTRSPTHQIRVNQPPTAVVESVSYDYPRYMGLARAAQPGGAIDAWEGTQVTVRARPNMPIKRAVLYCSDQESASETAEAHPMAVRDGLLEATWKLKFRDLAVADEAYARFYHIQVWNERDQQDPLPTIHRIKIRPDLKPEIDLIHPDKDLTAPRNAVVPIAFQARDPDFLLRRVALRLEQNGELLPVPPPLFEGPPDTAEFRSVYRLDLQKLAVVPGDLMTFYLEAEDNFEPFENRGKNITRTSRVTISIEEPQPEQQAEEFAERQEQQIREKIEEADPRERDDRRDPQQPPPQQPGDRESGDDPEPPKEPDPQQPRDAGEPGAGDSQADPDEQQPGEGGARRRPEDAGRSQDNGAPQPGSTDPGQPPDPGSPGDSPPTDAADGQPGRQNGQQQQNGQPDGQGRQPAGEPSPAGEGEREQQSPGARQQPRDDKAPDDRALRELLDWSREQEQRDPSPADPAAQQAGEDRPSPAEHEQRPDGPPESDSQSPSDADRQRPAADETEAAPGESPSSTADSSDPAASPGDSPRGAEQDGPAPDSPQDRGETGSGERPPADEPPPDDKASPGDAAPADLRERQPGESNPANGEPGKPEEKPEPGEAGADRPQDSPGEAGERPGQSDAQRDSGQQNPGDQPSQGSPPSADDPRAPGEAQPPGAGQSGTEPREGEPGRDSDAQPMPAGRDAESGQQRKPGEPSENRQRGDPGEASPQQRQPGDQQPEGQPQNGQQQSSQQQNGQQQNGQPSGDGRAPMQESQQQPSRGQPSSDADPHRSGADSGDSSSQQPAEEGTPPQNGQQSSSSPDDAAPPGTSQDGQPQQNGQQQNGQQQNGQQQNGQQQNGQQQNGQQQNGQQQNGQQQNGQQQNGQQQNGQQQNGQSGGQEPGGQQAADGNAQPGQEPGASGQPPTGQAGQPQQVKGSPGDGPAANGDVATAPEPADLANKKKATNLALKRLRDQLERGETPQELMDQLGFDEKDLESFMNRLEERLADPGRDQSPEADAARRQFESLLRGMDYQSQGQRREGGRHEREASESFGGAGRGTPPEFRLKEEGFRRQQSGQRAQGR